MRNTKRQFKSLVATLLIFVMLFGMSVTAFAAEEEPVPTGYHEVQIKS